MMNFAVRPTRNVFLFRATTYLVDGNLQDTDGPGILSYAVARIIFVANMVRRITGSGVC